MSITVKPATEFDDLALVLGPKHPESNVCWCLSWRLSSKENRSLVGPERAERVRGLCARAIAPGVLAYRDDEVAGWAGIAPLPTGMTRRLLTASFFPDSGRAQGGASASPEMGPQIMELFSDLQ